QYMSGSATATCVPTPQPPTLPPGPPTATPDVARIGTLTPGPRAPTLTPYPINKTTDLSPAVAAKGKVLVFHCDGTYEMFLTTNPAGPIPLQAGDTIVYRALPESALTLDQAPTARPWPTPTSELLTPLPPELTRTPGPYPPTTLGTQPPTETPPSDSFSTSVP